jgi:hypothetical protein
MQGFLLSVAMQLTKPTQTQYRNWHIEKSLLGALYCICNQYKGIVLLQNLQKRNLKFDNRNVEEFVTQLRNCILYTISNKLQGKSNLNIYTFRNLSVISSIFLSLILEVSVVQLLQKYCSFCIYLISIHSRWSSFIIIDEAFIKNEIHPPTSIFTKKFIQPICMIFIYNWWKLIIEILS